jgi:hypothetical protein
MTRRRIVWATFTLLTLGGLLSLYRLLFALWMTAYPYVNLNDWRTRFYVRLAITVVIGVVWSALAVWLFRHRRADASCNPC